MLTFQLIAVKTMNCYYCALFTEHVHHGRVS